MRRSRSGEKTVQGITSRPPAAQTQSVGWSPIELASAPAKSAPSGFALCVRKLIAPLRRPSRCGGVASCLSDAVFTSKSMTAIPPTNSDAVRIAKETRCACPGEARGTIARQTGKPTVAQRIVGPRPNRDETRPAQIAPARPPIAPAANAAPISPGLMPSSFEA
jgi:hypothetical protein